MVVRFGIKSVVKKFNLQKFKDIPISPPPKYINYQCTLQITRDDLGDIKKYAFRKHYYMKKLEKIVLLPNNIAHNSKSVGRT